MFKKHSHYLIAIIGLYATASLSSLIDPVIGIVVGAAVGFGLILVVWNWIVFARKQKPKSDSAN
jgi:hypothetical protein